VEALLREGIHGRKGQSRSTHQSPLS
jgi:hypothetical protein